MRHHIKKKIEQNSSGEEAIRRAVYTNSYIRIDKKKCLNEKKCIYICNEDGLHAVEYLKCIVS